MDSRLLALADTQDGTFSVADATRVDVGKDALDALVSSRAIVRVRRGAYVLGDRWRAASGDEQEVMRIKALLRARPGDAASHHSGLLLHGIRTFDRVAGRVDLASSVNKSRVRAGVRTHPMPPTIILAGPWRMVTLPTALAQVAGEAGLPSAVVSLDHAVHDRRCTIEEVAEAVEALPTAVARRRAGRALARVDAACESVGETRTRLLLQDLGFAVTSQVAITTSVGAVRVDFLVGGAVVVEFDGKVKYEGADGRDALVWEKRRESALVDLGYEVIRVLWADLDDPRALARRIRAAHNRSVARRAVMA